MIEGSDHRLARIIADQTVEYLGIGAVHWPAANMLIVADLHLGKSITFRRSGIPIPEGADLQTLLRLKHAIEVTKPRTLLILGDFIHARGGWNDRLVGHIHELRQRYWELRWQLVLGNHDRGSVARLQQFDIQLFSPPYQVDPFIFLHEPSRAEQMDDRDRPFYMAGHLHPSISLSTWGRVRTRLKCFWERPSGLILPAFGEFTGGANCQPSENDRIVGIADGELIEIDLSKSTILARSRATKSL